MELEVNFTYPVVYVPHRHHNERRAFGRAATRVRIREVPLGETKPAFRVSDPEHARYRPIDGRPREMIGWAGKLWLEYGDAAAFARRFETEEFPRNTPFDCSGHLKIDHTRGPHGDVQVHDLAAVRRRYVGMRRWEDDRGARMAQIVADRAADMIVVDGRIYVRDYEPCWVWNRRRLSLGAVPFDPGEPFSDGYRDGFVSMDMRWRADRRAEAEAARGDVDGDAAVAPDGPEEAFLEVLDPAFIRYADDSEALVEAAGEALEALARSLPALPAEAAERLYDLRDALVASGGGISPFVVDAVVRTAALDPAVAIPDTRDKADGARHALERAVSQCTAAAARWERRPDDAREWVHLGFQVTSTRQEGRRVREVLSLHEAGRAARALGRDLSRFEEAAAEGRARFLAVENAYHPFGERPVLAAVLVAEGADGPRVVETCARDGEAGDVEVAAALAHWRAARAAEPGQGAENEMQALRPAP